MPMKLGEALSERARLQRKIGELRERINANTTVHEGEEVAEDANQLAIEVEDVTKSLENLIVRINLANASTRVDSGETLTELLAKRDSMASLAATYNGAATAAQDRDRNRIFGRTGDKVNLAVNVPTLRERAEDALDEMRRLDNQIQEANWSTEV